MIRYQVLENLQLNFLSKFVGEQYMSNIEAEASKLDSYFKSDLNIEYVWDNAPWFESVVFTGLVNNIFDEKYVSNGYYSPAFGPGFYPQAGINYLAGVTLKF
jgi:iron complex outermembrane receptor protein